MVDIADIVDRKSLEAWLKALSGDNAHAIAEVIAVRAALRVMPHWALYFDDKQLKSEAPEFTGQLFRCTLTTAVAPVSPTAAVRTAAAFSADSAADSATLSAARSALYAARSALSAADSAALSAAFSALSTAATVGMFDTIRADCDFALTSDPVALLTSPLWPETTPEPQDLTDNWQSLKGLLENDSADWSFWITFAEAMRAGRKQNWKLLEEIALLPDEDWKQGPGHINPLIAGVAAKYKGKTGSGSDDPNAPVAEQVETALASNQLRAAIADFTYDDLSQLMRMVPFLDDIKAIDDPDIAQDRANKLSELYDGFADLAEDIRADNKNVPSHLLRNLDRYCAEATKPVEAIRPGRLWDLGTNLQTEALNEDTIFALGDGLSGHYQRMVEKHLDLMKDYFAATLARMQNVDHVLLRDDINPSDAFDRIKAAHDALFVDPDQSLPRLDPEDAAVLKEELDELERRKAALDATSDPNLKEAREKEYWKHVKTVSVTLIRYSLKAAQVTWKGVKDLNSVVKTFTRLWPEQTRAAIERLVEILQNVPWPF